MRPRDGIAKARSQARLGARLLASPLRMPRDIVTLWHEFSVGGVETTTPERPACLAADSDWRPAFATIVQLDGDVLLTVHQDELRQEISRTGLTSSQIFEDHLDRVRRRLEPLRDLEAAGGLIWSMLGAAMAAWEIGVIATQPWTAIPIAAMGRDVGLLAAPAMLPLLRKAAAPLLRRWVAARFGALDRTIADHTRDRYRRAGANTRGKS